jgi:hypothetical protein
MAQLQGYFVPPVMPSVSRYSVYPPQNGTSYSKAYTAPSSSVQRTFVLQGYSPLPAAFYSPRSGATTMSSSKIVGPPPTSSMALSPNYRVYPAGTSLSFRNTVSRAAHYSRRACSSGRSAYPSAVPQSIVLNTYPVHQPAHYHPPSQVAYIPPRFRSWTRQSLYDLTRQRNHVDWYAYDNRRHANERLGDGFPPEYDPHVRFPPPPLSPQRVRFPPLRGPKNPEDRRFGTAVKSSESGDDDDEDEDEAPPRPQKTRPSSSRASCCKCSYHNESRSACDSAACNPNEPTGCPGKCSSPGWWPLISGGDSVGHYNPYASCTWWCDPGGYCYAVCPLSALQQYWPSPANVWTHSPALASQVD